MSGQIMVLDSFILGVLGFCLLERKSWKILKKRLKNIVYDREQEAYADRREVEAFSNLQNPF